MPCLHRRHLAILPLFVPPIAASTLPSHSTAKNHMKRDDRFVCGPYYGKPIPSDCRDLIYHALPHDERPASFGIWGPPISYYGDCTLEIEHRSLPTQDTVSWTQIDAAVERILGFCTVPSRGEYGGRLVIGQNENIVVIVSGPHPEDEGRGDDNFEMIPVSAASRISDAMNRGASDALSKKRCRGLSIDFEDVARSSADKQQRTCTDTCDRGSELSKPDLIFGLTQLREWTVFFCGWIMAGIVEAGVGS